MISENHHYLKLGIATGMGISELEQYGLTPRTINMLECGGIITLRDLLQHTEEQLLAKRNIGVTTIKQIRKAVLAIGTK
jgi:DNA-directed RNA polymerase alpha subunit